MKEKVANGSTIVQFVIRNYQQAHEEKQNYVERVIGRKRR